MKKQRIIIAGIILLIIIVVFAVVRPFYGLGINDSGYVGLDDNSLTNTITATGDIEAENQATLTFLNAGRLAYINFKEGDQVYQGQVLAGLDTTIVSHNITAAEAQYRSAEAQLNKVLDDIHLFQYGNGGFDNVGTGNETQTQKTLRQQTEEATNVAFDNLQNAKKQLDYSTIVAPFDGKILSIQNIKVGQNISAASGSYITLVGSGALKFRVNVLEQDINNVSLGENVTIKLDSNKEATISGTVSKIAPDKTTLPDNRIIYKVDIESNLQNVKPGQTGQISFTIDRKNGIRIPSWIVLGNKYVWVYSDSKIVLKEVKVGETAGNFTQIISGLTAQDQVITNPEIIAKSKYTLL